MVTERIPMTSNPTESTTVSPILGPNMNKDSHNTDKMALNRSIISIQNDTNVRKAGKVLIRGMFRRVWRPRYLEIRNDGSVRYYEPYSKYDLEALNYSLHSNVDHNSNEGHDQEIQWNNTAMINEIKSATSLKIPLHQSDDNVSTFGNNSTTNSMDSGGDQSQQSPNSNPKDAKIDSWDVLSTPSPNLSYANSKKHLRLKATMMIHDVRAIDATHRDAHIGLPRNVFGFLFHSQTTPVDQNQHSQSHHLDTHTKQFHQEQHEKEIQHDMKYFPKYDQYQDHGKTKVNENSPDKGQKGPFPSIPDTYNGAIKHLQKLNAPPSRDYMCAVSTEEEAREWLIALQWAAAKMGTDTLFLNKDSKEKQQLQPNLKDREDQFLMEDYCIPSLSAQSVPATASSNPILVQTANDLSQIRRRKGPSNNDEVDMNANSGQMIPKQKKRTRTRTRSRNEGKIVVTKVRKFRIQLIPFQMVYEIRMLLIDYSNPKQTTSNTEGQKTDDNKQSVEERTIFHSHHDFHILLKQLKDECKSTNPNSLRNQGNTFHILQRADMDLVRNMHDWNAVKEDTNSALDENDPENILLKNIDTLDKVLRLLTSDPTTCNSKSMREFLFLKHSGTASHESKRHDICKKKLCFEANESTDDFVKKWLWHDINDTISSSKWAHFFIMLTCLRYKRLLLQLLLSLFVFMYIEINPPRKHSVSGEGNERWWQRNITMRVDILLAVILISFALGREFSRLNMKAQLHMSTTSESSRKAIRNYIQNSSWLERLLRFLRIMNGEDESQSTNTGEKDVKDKVVNKKRKEVAKGHNHPHHTNDDDDDEDDDDDDDETALTVLPSPLSLWPGNGGICCWSEPRPTSFKIRGKNYLSDKVKVKSTQSMFACQGVDMWLSDEPMTHIARHPSVLGGKLHRRKEDTLVINFLLPFGNFVGYFTIPPMETLPDHFAHVWTQFRNGNQKYRDARLKLLPVVIDGPWIVRKAVGPGSAPAVLGKVIPLTYYETPPPDTNVNADANGHSPYILEVDINITSSRIAKAILNVVKGHTEVLTIALAFIIEAVSERELPECVLGSFQIHEIDIGKCPKLPPFQESV